MAIIRNPLIVFNGGEQEIEYDNYITFLDKNGKLLYQYTITNFVNASMPSAPIDDVVGEGKWNIPTKDAIIEYFNRYNKVVVGPTYNICESTKIVGDVFIYRIKLLNDKSTISIPFSYDGSVMGIEWGDGNTQLLNAGQTSISHTYENSGDYIIKIKSLSTSSESIYSLGDLSNITDSATKLFQQSLYEVNVGKFTGRTQYLNTSIHDNAFYGCYNLKCVTLPDNVSIIGKNCFYNTNIENVFINATLDSTLYDYESLDIFNTGSFQNCFSLCNVSAYSGNKNIIEIRENAFSNCYKLQNFFSPNFNSSGGGKINAMSFEHCYSLRNFFVPQNTSYIYAYAFSNCVNLEYLYIGSNVIAITSSAFDVTNDTFGIFINPAYFTFFSSVVSNVYCGKSLSAGGTFPNSADGASVQNNKWYETKEDTIYDRNAITVGSTIPKTKEYYCKLKNKTQPSSES